MSKLGHDIVAIASVGCGVVATAKAVLVVVSNYQQSRHLIVPGACILIILFFGPL